jgi:hypothetical protein
MGQVAVVLGQDFAATHPVPGATPPGAPAPAVTASPAPAPAPAPPPPAEVKPLVHACDE